MAGEELIISKFKELVEAIKASNLESGSSPLDSIGVSDAFTGATPEKAVIDNNTLTEILSKVDATGDKIAMAVNISKWVRGTIGQVASLLS